MPGHRGDLHDRRVGDRTEYHMPLTACALSFLLTSLSYGLPVQTQSCITSLVYTPKALVINSVSVTRLTAFHLIRGTLTVAAPGDGIFKTDFGVTP